MNNVDRRQFSCTLPPFLKILALAGATNDEEKGDKNKGGPHLKNLKRTPEDADLDTFNDPNKGSKTVKNIKPNKTWLLKDNESFGSVFHKQIKTCPKQGRQFVCLKFWIKGSCFKNCKHLHADITEETKTNLDAWITKCRSDFP